MVGQQLTFPMTINIIASSVAWVLPLLLCAVVSAIGCRLQLLNLWRLVADFRHLLMQNRDLQFYPVVVSVCL